MGGSYVSRGCIGPCHVRDYGWGHYACDNCALVYKLHRQPTVAEYQAMMKKREERKKPAKKAKKR